MCSRECGRHDVKGSFCHFNGLSIQFSVFSHNLMVEVHVCVRECQCERVCVCECVSVCVLCVRMCVVCIVVHVCNCV